MLGGVAGRHISNRRRDSSPMVRFSVGGGSIGGGSSLEGGSLRISGGHNATGNATGLDNLPLQTNNVTNSSCNRNSSTVHIIPRVPARRRRAVTTSDYKSCAIVQTRLKLGDIM